MQIARTLSDCEPEFSLTRNYNFSTARSTGLPALCVRQFLATWIILTLLDIRSATDLPKIINATSGQSAWYVSEQNLLLQADIDDLVDDIEKKKAEVFQ